MRLLSARRALGAALVPLMLVGVSACGDDEKDSKASDKSSAGNPFGSGDSSDDASASGDDATTDSSDSSDEGDADVDVAKGAEVPVADFAALMEAAASDPETSKIKMEMTAAGMSMTGDGQIDPTDPKNPKMQLSMDMGSATGTMDMLLVDGSAYMKMTAMGPKWFKMTADQLGQASGGQDLTSQMDSAKQLENLKPGLKKVVFVGETQRGDGDAKEYSVTVDSSKIETMKAVPGMPPEITYSIFFDDEDRMTGMDTDVAGSVVKLTMSDFGTDVDVKAPAASEISDQPMPGMS